MIRTISRVFTVGFLSIITLFLSISTVAAAGNWSWTDLSDKIAERQNRPVWAMAYAAPFWYFTDGQELWSGGHVWKTEGSITSDITAEIRNAGVSRVDDIVSDGQTVLFLKNTAQRNNTIEIVALNGGYHNLTSIIRQNLAWNEGTVSINGANGTWGIATSFGRVLLYTPSSNVVRTIQLQGVNTQIPYTQNHASAQSGSNLLFALQPVEGSWIAYTLTSSGVRFQKIDQYGNVSTLSYPGLTGDRIMMMSSNGRTALIGGYRQTGASIAYTYNGASFQTITQTGLPASWSSSVAAWNGTSWLVLQEKNLYRFEGNAFENLGTTRDFFLTIASNGSGTFLLGGAVSDIWSGMNPTYPLTLKLAKAQETYLNASNTQTNSNVQIQNGTSFWTWTDPSQTWIRRDQTVSYSVGTWNTVGIKRVEIYANGIIRRTCELGRAYGNQTCSATLYGGDYALNTSVAVNAKITDGSDGAVWTALQYLTVADTNGTSGGTPVGDLSAWSWLDPTGSTLNRNGSVTFRTQANATRGLNKIEIYVNGTLSRTCTFSSIMNTQSCDLAVYGGNYGTQSNVSLNAKATDSYGQSAWSDTKTVSIQDTGSTSGTMTQDTSWTWTEPEGTDISTNASRIFKIGAWSKDGIRRIEIYVNGSLQRTCDLGYSVNATVECAQYLYGSSYTQGSDVFINAKITSGNGTVTWSTSKTYHIVAVGSSTGTGTAPTSTPPAAIHISSNHDNGFENNETVTFVATAEDSDGVLTMELLVNAILVKTCTNVSSCSYTGGPYNTRTSVSYGAKLMDHAGTALWTGYTTIYKR